MREPRSIGLLRRAGDLKSRAIPPSDETRALRPRRARPPLAASLREIVRSRAAQLAAEGTEWEPVCACGSPRSPRYPERCTGGHPLPGLPGPALRHGGRAELATLAAQRGAVEALASLQAEIEADLGGADRLSRIHRNAVRDLLRLELVGEFLFDRLTKQGPLTPKGRTRAALSAYLATVDRLHRLRQLIGLERRQRPVDPLAALAAAVDRAHADAERDRTQETEPEPEATEPTETEIDR